MGGAAGYNLARFTTRNDSQKEIHAAMPPSAAFIRITVALNMICWHSSGGARAQQIADIPNTAPFSKESLRRGKILVVANAKAGIMAQREPLCPQPTAPGPRRPLL